MPFLLSNAVFLSALGALAVPLLLHLLMRQRQVRMRFSTVRFFDSAPPPARARRRVRNWLLLLLRMACLALVVLAFVRPFLPMPAPEGGARRPRRVVVLIDRSLSMQATDATGTRWTRALEAASKALSGLGPLDRAALVAMDGLPEVLAPMGPPQVALAALREVRPGHGMAALSAGLAEALRVHGPRVEGMDASIVVVSDLQESAVADVGTTPVPPDMGIQVVAVGERRASNLAVTDLQPDPGGDVVPFVTVANHGDAPLGTSVELGVDGKVLWTRPVTLASGAVTNLDLNLPTLAEGWHRAEARISGADALAADNVRLATFRSPAPVRVLLLEGRPEARSFQRQAFFIEAALAPNLDVAGAPSGRFKVGTCAPGELATRLEAGPGTHGPPWDVVLVTAQREWPADAVRALEGFVSRGGGAAFFMEAKADAGAFNAAWDGWMAAEVLPEESAPAENPWRIGVANRATAVFDAFRNPGSGNLAVPEFVRRWPLQPVPGAMVLARWDDGLPWAVAHGHGKGRVVVVGITPDNAGGDWPKHKTFVPFVHGLARHLAGRADDRLVLAPPSAVCGVESVLPVSPPRPASAGASPTNVAPALRLLLPDGSRLAMAPDDSGDVRVESRVPGVVRVQGPDGADLHQVAFNPPPSESALSGATPLQVEQRMDRRDAVSGGAVMAGWLGADPGRREWWRVLLLCAAGLLLLETVVANRTAP